MTRTNPLLKPRRVNYGLVGLGIGLGLVMVVGIWYIYAAQQSRTMATRPPGTNPPPTSTGVGIETGKLAYDKPKVTPAVVQETNGTKPPAPDEPGLVQRLTTRVGELEAELAGKVVATVTGETAPAKTTTSTHARTQTPAKPNPEIAMKRKALAESRKAVLVVVRTPVKASDVMESARTLQPGWKIPFLVETAIHSDIGGEFVARVSETVYASGDYRVPLIPSGASVMGSAQSAKLVPGNERLPLMGVNLSIPGLKPIDLGSMPVMDQEGQLGMVDEINHHYARMIGGIFVRGVMTGSTRVIQAESRQAGPLGEIGAGVAQGANQATNQQTQALYDVRPTIKIQKGSRGYVLVTKPLAIPRVPGGIE